ncbi:uncharacterized protein GLRG_05136 [Colletotrichum graminicola M1.001]|uniref:Uncharacterized protein n=1 Tax=Colletotrichum graminicola (strain M1.001 / M2 / FGSC 10212) TaxID=645133 RepID=E3QGK4_COLGM|nr:uncharacterized protein GLRG_05136 [Colletotrichum graminicola M1.001]EFQ29992.1 hypothetical protein GLRG_05136 [Colletotrichum graminicola M1.001]
MGCRDISMKGSGKAGGSLAVLEHSRYKGDGLGVATLASLDWLFWLLWGKGVLAAFPSYIIGGDVVVLWGSCMRMASGVDTSVSREGPVLRKKHVPAALSLSLASAELWEQAAPTAATEFHNMGGVVRQSGQPKQTVGK